MENNCQHMWTSYYIVVDRDDLCERHCILGCGTLEQKCIESQVHKSVWSHDGPVGYLAGEEDKRRHYLEILKRVDETNKVTFRHK